MLCFRCLEGYYPHFPSKRELTHYVLSSGDLQQHSEGGKLQFLAKFALEQPQLQKGGAILPDLVELYQWLHTHYAHLLTPEQARSITIGQVVKFAEKNLNKELGKHIRSLYDRVKQGYNQYLELVGGAMGVWGDTLVQGKWMRIEDNTPLVNLLTGGCTKFFCHLRCNA